MHKILIYNHKTQTSRHHWPSADGGVTSFTDPKTLIARARAIVGTLVINLIISNDDRDPRFSSEQATPTALAPWIIRWGADASSDLLRRSARCTECGGEGATIQIPVWGGLQTPVRGWPAESHGQTQGSS
jgi:hypothetical protein